MTNNLKTKLGLVLVIIILIIAGIYFNKSDKIEVVVGALSPKDATYTISDKAVTLANGKAEIQIALGSAMQEKVAMFGEPIMADLDKDGDLDAVSYLTTDAGGSGTFFYVVVAENVGGKYFGTNAMFLGDRIAPQNINFLDGRAVANFAERRANEPMTVQPSIGKSVWIQFDPLRREIGEWVKDFEGESNVVCTMEAKLCSDGSYVGRSGPKCEFAKCPSGEVND